jgi:glycosyltransferase involved in cell wall biosynthesis
MSHPLNILHIVPKLSTWGGIGNQLLLVLKQYPRSEFFPIVCSLRDKGVIGKEIEDLGIEVVCLNRDFKRGFYWTIVKELYSLINRRNIQIVRTHEYRANLHGRLAALLARVPCIMASVHNVYNRRDQKLNRRIINRYLGTFTDKVVAVSEEVKNEILRYDRVPEHKIAVIHNGVDRERFINIDAQSIRSEFHIPLSAPVVGTVGRFFPQKGQKYLLDAIAQLRNKLPSIVVLMVGDGPLKDELENHAKNLGIQRNVMFTGIRRDIPALLAAMDVFVFPSLWEGFGNALIEAMAAGKPIVATDIPPVREIMNSEKLGIIVPPANPEAIATSLELLLSDKTFAQDLGNSAQEKAFSSFTIDNTVQRYRSLYKSILEEKHISLS